MVKRCFGALFSEPPVVEALSFLDRTDRERLRFLALDELRTKVR